MTAARNVPRRGTRGTRVASLDSRARGGSACSACNGRTDGISGVSLPGSRSTSGAGSAATSTISTATGWVSTTTPRPSARARARGLLAYTPDEFAASEFAIPGRFDSLLASHVVEHMTADAAAELVQRHLAYVRTGGKAIFITPQERGFRSDPTHVALYGFDELDALLDRLELVRDRAYSFPFPRVAGKVFTHNEFVVVAHCR